MAYPSDQRGGLYELVNTLSSPATAVVLDSGGLSALGVVRSLGRVGVEVWLAGDNAGSPASKSRFVRRFLELPPLAEPDRYMEALTERTDREARRLLLFCADAASAVLVSDQRSRLPTNVDLQMAAADLVSACHSTVAFHELSSQRGLPVPASRVCQQRRQVEAAVQDFAGRAVLRRERKAGWTGAAWPAGARHASAVLTPGEDLPPWALETFRTGGSCVVQEYVPGPDASVLSVHAFRSRSSEREWTFVGQKIRGSGSGPPVIVRSRSAPSAAALALDVLKALDFRGPAVAEFKRHAVSGRLLLLSLFSCYSPWCELAERCGVNLPALAYLDAHDSLPSPAETAQRDGLYWWDLAGAWSTLRRPQVPWRARLANLVPPPGRPLLARLRFGDPAPGMGRFARSDR